ncbi:MAG: hypothetical protein IT365_16300 [Candidatus Hydrogenedentes bacterium]|nr:hypothetical protein [Candidatus Hydrogenedentota bacterium]
MRRRERLMCTLRGQTVDRPPACFYEINGLDEDPNDKDPFNIYTDPSWRPLIELARDRTDRIVMRGVSFHDVLPDPVEEISHAETYFRDGKRYRVHHIRAGNRVLTSRTRRDPDVNTEWTEEPLLKDVDDLDAFLDLPTPELSGEPDVSGVLDAEIALGDTGIVMIDTPDPLCLAAMLFEIGTYTVIAMTCPDRFHRLLQRFAGVLHAKTKAVAEALPGRLWRIYGPEYASPPHLPPALFREYVPPYVRPMVHAIQRHGGFARIHSHGRLHAILDDIADMNPDGLDPIEPPPQGDVSLKYVRERYGQNMVLFGNLEVSDIETLPTADFVEKVRRALDEGTAGQGRGFVLMPSAAPYGRVLPKLTLKNYEAIVEAVESL